MDLFSLHVLAGNKKLRLTISTVAHTCDSYTFQHFFSLHFVFVMNQVTNLSIRILVTGNGYTLCIFFYCYFPLRNHEKFGNFSSRPFINL